MTDKILTIDIGNSNINIGLFKDDTIRTVSLSTRPLKDRAFYEGVLREFLGDDQPAGAVLSSVVPSHDGLFYEILETLTGEDPVVVTHSINTGLIFDVAEPGSIGADRIANAVAACSRINGSLVVVDLGTATTITVVDREKRLIGGVIMPGVEMMCVALNRQTCKLPLVMPVSLSGPLGKDTKSSIISGVGYGTAGAVDRLLDEISVVLGEFVAVLTGGNAPLIKGLLKREYIYIPELTLTGLRIIHERNRG
ncbi:Pantothenate kinase type III, CoaX-like [hydrothermal vent metagenome]|uniref:Type III pantothenate kinase n=1 Tax=hydrothermal vent metagenome TaxID=652676 RepID=A0A3B1D155_9ZZZZ